MCGRYVFTPGTYERFKERFDVQNEIELEERYNVAPGQMMPVVTRKSPNKAEVMKWGLIPFWAKDPRIGYKMINARVESIAFKPSFRKAFRTQRCLVPANGFYEWQRTDGKQPYYVRKKDNELVAFAGIYDVWKDAEGKEIKTYTIITTKPNKLLELIHDRMPVILKKENEGKWLDKNIQEPKDLVPLLDPISEKGMEAYPVSRAVNKANIDSEKLISLEEPGQF